MATKLHILLATLIICVGTTVFGCSASSPIQEPGGNQLLGITFSSPAFADMGTIPNRYTCTGANISPPLEWQNSTGAVVRSHAIVVDSESENGDIQTHWLAYNIPADVHTIREAESNFGNPQGSKWQLLRNDFGDHAWRGPCPAVGDMREYTFFIYALDAQLELGREATRNDFIVVLRQVNVLAVGRFTAYYAR